MHLKQVVMVLKSSVEGEIVSNNPNNYCRKINLNMKSNSLPAFDERSTQRELSPILTCIRSIQDSETLWGSEKLNQLKRLSLKELKNEQNLKYEDGFCFAVSLQDGSTLYVASAITRHLGYPKDMLVGQCIMNFLYQKDHITFANHLTQGLNACFNQGTKDETHLVPNTFFCRLRLYHGLKFGYSVSERKTQYKPFKVTLHVNDLIFDDVCVEKVTSTLCVKATATPLSSAYQAPGEIPAMTSFSTRHTASCHFSHVDASAIPYLGYLPQDMIGYSVFDFYHIDDMLQLKDMYELVIKERGSAFRSKPYRFKVFNGSYITLETEWSSFINPWSRKLEFVVGHHRVLKGPVDINIFDPANMEESMASDESLKESQNMQKEISSMLAQPIKDCVVGKTKRFCNKRKRDLASFVYNFIDDEGKEKEYGEKNFDDYNSLDSDSVVRGDISPHQDMNKSSTFSETPPTCVELRYKENIERFFASQPKTLSYGSEECKSEEKLSSSDNSNGSGSVSMSSLTNDFSEHKSLEADDLLPTSASVANTQAWGKREDNADMEKYPLCMTLTEESLLQHNRMNHKYNKHRQSKENVTQTYKENDWLKHNDLGNLNIGSSPHKPRKCARIQATQSSTILTQQIEEPKTSLPQQSMFSFNPPFSIGTYGIPMGHSATTTTQSAPTSLTYPSFGVPSYPFMSSNCNHATPASPFFIPVMYMGPLPYYPSVPNVMLPSSVPVWPCTPGPPSASPVVFPAIPTSYPVPMSTSQMPSSSVDSCNVQLSGATATTTVLTTSVAPGLGTASEDMDLESKFVRKCKRHVREDPPWLAGVNLTADVVYRYQMTDKNMEEVLMKDMETLKTMSQPQLVNKQLELLQHEFKDEKKAVLTASDSAVNDSLMLGLTTHDDNEKGELMDNEDNLFEIMVQDE